MSYVHLLPSCIVTEGYRRALLHDTQNNRSRLLSRGLAAALQRFSGRQVVALLAHLQQSGMSQHEADNMLDTLAAEGFLLFSPVRIPFEPLHTAFHQPLAITNAIVDIALTNLHLLPQMLTCFRSIDCPHLQLRVYSNVFPDAELLRWLAAFAVTDTMHTVDLILPFFDDYQSLPGMLRPAVLTSLVLYRAPYNDVQQLSNRSQVIFLSQTLDFPHCCGIVDMAYFNFSLPHYMEARHYNSCLNRKISIDHNGHIKNCPSMQQHYGHVLDTDWAKVLETQAFRQPAYITKDLVAICRDCEFRYVCTDCRAYLEQPNDVYSKPLKCGYDPYTCTWADWSDHPAKQTAMAYYGW
jgi:SPASM domain peptide maturase of grasp-with-spasm system